VSYTSQTTGICAVSGSSVTLVAVGQCSIQATQTGDTNWGAATAVDRSFQVTPGSQSINFATLSDQAFGSAAFGVSATATSGLAVSFASTTSSVCTVSGPTVTLVSAGTCTIQATQAGNTNYAAATPVNRSFQVTQVSQTINFGALSNRLLGTAPFTVSATASSGLAVSFGSNTPAVCTVSGTTVTLVSTGTCTVQATQAGNTNYGAAPPVNRSFQVELVAVTIASSPAGLAVTVDGVVATTPATFNWVVGSSHSLDAAAVIPGATGTRLSWQNWSRGGAASQTISAPASAATYTASYQTQYYLTVNTAGNGTVSPPAGWFDTGSVVRVTATPGSGSYLIAFSGSLTGTVNPQDVTITGPMTATASFGNQGAYLTASIGAKADGNVTNERVWMINLTNTGTAAATNAVITNVQILGVTGAAAVSVKPAMPLPLAVGTIAPGATGNPQIRLIFPATVPASRISIQINYAADGGVSGKTVFNSQFR